MGRFTREGTFTDRGRFLQAFRDKLAQLRAGALAGMTETWEQAGGADVARLAGFGARVEFTIGPSSWSCAAEFPSWIPIPQRSVEEKFDREFEGLGGL